MNSLLSTRPSRGVLRLVALLLAIVFFHDAILSSTAAPTVPCPQTPGAPAHENDEMTSCIPLDATDADHPATSSSSRLRGGSVVVSGEPLEVFYVGSPPEGLYLDGSRVSFEVDVERELVIVGAENLPASGGHDLSVFGDGGGGMSFVVNAPSPWHAVSYWHSGENTTVCGADERGKTEIDRLRVLAEPIISCFAFRGHSVAVVVGDEEGKGFGELGDAFVRHTINLAKACADEYYIYGIDEVNGDARSPLVEVGIMVLLGLRFGEIEEKLADGNGGMVTKVGKFGVAASWREKGGFDEEDVHKLVQKFGEMAGVEEGGGLGGGWGVEVHTLEGHYCGEKANPPGMILVATITSTLSVANPTPANRVTSFVERLNLPTPVPDAWRTSLHVGRSELEAYFKGSGFAVVHEKDNGKESGVILANAESNVQVKITNGDWAGRECYNLFQVAGSEYFAKPFSYALAHEGLSNTVYSVCAYERVQEASPWEDVEVGLKGAASLVRAVAELKRKGFEHRDITKSNVLVLKDGRVRIIDFTWALPLNGAGYDYEKFSFVDGILSHGMIPNVGAPNDLSAMAQLLLDVPIIEQCLETDSIATLNNLLQRQVARRPDHSNEVVVRQLESLAARLYNCHGNNSSPYRSYVSHLRSGSAKEGSSQSETPGLSSTHNPDGGGTISLEGYQIFDLEYLPFPPHLQISTKSPALHHKANLLSQTLHSVSSLFPSSPLSYADVGTSNGFLLHVASLTGVATSILGVDHDTEYISNAAAAIDMLHSHLPTQATLTKPHTASGNLQSQPNDLADVVSCFAVIHWAYSATATFRNLDVLVGHMSRLSKHATLIQWISPDDAAIRYLDHIHLNGGTTDGPNGYNEHNFLAALDKHCSRVEDLGIEEGRESRRTFLCWR